MRSTIGIHCHRHRGLEPEVLFLGFLNSKAPEPEVILIRDHGVIWGQNTLFDLNLHISRGHFDSRPQCNLGPKRVILDLNLHILYTVLLLKTDKCLKF